MGGSKGHDKAAEQAHWDRTHGRPGPAPGGHTRPFVLGLSQGQP